LTVWAATPRAGANETHVVTNMLANFKQAKVSQQKRAELAPLERERQIGARFHLPGTGTLVINSAGTHTTGTARHSNTHG
jgi:hypothetical protein